MCMHAAFVVLRVMKSRARDQFMHMYASDVAYGLFFARIA